MVAPTRRSQLVGLLLGFVLLALFTSTEALRLHIDQAHQEDLKMNQDLIIGHHEGLETAQGLRVHMQILQDLKQSKKITTAAYKKASKQALREASASAKVTHYIAGDRIMLNLEIHPDSEGTSSERPEKIFTDEELEAMRNNPNATISAEMVDTIKEIQEEYVLRIHAQIERRRTLAKEREEAELQERREFENARSVREMKATLQRRREEEIRRQQELLEAHQAATNTDLFKKSLAQHQEYTEVCLGYTCDDVNDHFKLKISSEPLTAITNALIPNFMGGITGYVNQGLSSNLNFNVQYGDECVSDWAGWYGLGAMIAVEIPNDAFQLSLGTLNIEFSDAHSKQAIDVTVTVNDISASLSGISGYAVGCFTWFTAACGVSFGASVHINSAQVKLQLKVLEDGQTFQIIPKLVDMDNFYLTLDYYSFTGACSLANHVQSELNDAARYIFRELSTSYKSEFSVMLTTAAHVALCKSVSATTNCPKLILPTNLAALGFGDVDEEGMTVGVNEIGVKLDQAMQAMLLDKGIVGADAADIQFFRKFQGSVEILPDIRGMYYSDGGIIVSGVLHINAQIPGRSLVLPQFSKGELDEPTGSDLVNLNVGEGLVKTIIDTAWFLVWNNIPNVRGVLMDIVDEEIGELAGDIMEGIFPSLYMDKRSAWCNLYDTGGLACPFPPIAFNAERWTGIHTILSGVFGGLTKLFRWDAFKIVTLADPPKVTFVSDHLNGQIKIEGTIRAMVIGEVTDGGPELLVTVTQDFNLPLNLPSFDMQTTTFKWDGAVSGLRPNYIGDSRLEINELAVDELAQAVFELLNSNGAIIKEFLNPIIKVILSTTARELGIILPELQEQFKAALPATSDFMGQRFDMAVSPQAFMDTSDRPLVEAAINFVDIPELTVGTMINVQQGSITISLPDYGSSAELKPVKLEVKGNSPSNRDGQSYLSIGTDICLVTGPVGPNSEHTGSFIEIRKQ